MERDVDELQVELGVVLVLEERLVEGALGGRHVALVEAKEARVLHNEVALHRLLGLGDARPEKDNQSPVITLS